MTLLLRLFYMPFYKPDRYSQRKQYPVAVENKFNVKQQIEIPKKQQIND